MKSTRVFQLTALALVLVSVVQVAWWVFDQRSYTQRNAQTLRSAYAGQAAAAQALLEGGSRPERIHELLPNILVSDGHAALSPAASAALAAEQVSRHRQYAWEGAFFLLALGLCIAVIARALRAEAHVLAEQDSFLALVSHQFKTPLASLQLSLETLALRTPPPPQARVLIDRMLADVARMELMVTQILESARLERGRADFRSEPVQLAGAVASDIEPGLSVVSDPLALDVVMRNVLENALAALAPVGRGSIALTARARGDEVELAVRDSGVGFATADGPRLFEKFTRLHPGGGGGYYGTGLGLFIVRRLMELAQGRVSAHSDGPGQGASFLLTWPAAPGQRS
jgi:signal transduction histidine kinase